MNHSKQRLILNGAYSTHKKSVKIANPNIKQMSIDALIENIKPKFIINFYEFQRNSL